MTSPIAIIGAELTGCCVALELARRHHDVTLIEQDALPMNRASLRNEGKIHLAMPKRLRGDEYQSFDRYDSEKIVLWTHAIEFQEKLPDNINVKSLSGTYYRSKRLYLLFKSMSYR